MNDHNGFNLLDEPWIVVLENNGREQEVSILQLFDYARHFAAIGGEVPTQAFAITRLLLAFLHRAIDGPADQDEWLQLWTSDRLPMDQIRAYADRIRHRFDLFDPIAPFYQVANLRSSSGDLTHPRKIVADMPDPGKDDLPLFTTRTVSSLSSIKIAEAARWLVHTHAFDPTGTKTGVVDGGSRYGPSLGWCGQIGGVLPEGKNLHETLLLNLIARDVETYVRIGAPDDLPPWERDPCGPEWQERPAHGAIDLYTWQTRRIRLARKGDGVVGVVLANGDKIAPQNMHGIEPHCGWRYDEQQTKKQHGIPVYVPLKHDPARSVWRGIGALLPSTSGRRTNTGAEPKRFLAPGVLQWISDLVQQGVLPEGYKTGLHVYGAKYGPGRQTSTWNDIIDDNLPVSLLVLREDHPEAGRAAVEAVADADQAASETWKLADNVAQAAGAEPKSGAGESARELLYAALEEPYRRWVATLVPGVDIDAARCRWREVVSESARQIAAQVVSAAPPSAWVGRKVSGHLINVSIAETWFNAAIRRLFPPARPNTTTLEVAAP
ncbi:CRISPR-associated protein, Cse1 family [Mycobacterium xenopi RIVM700367]|uniref:type I-E CRISPR-associated protein Cse1/CasA n=1 Tax=Mycobacterium xenopi TaxID=1789 RepID=UPI00025AE69E|nr:type I-E CRISPR-associated protein Cse1/CasA [Mycobacterium xenopi]EID12765.1 CRISPR-associated protein, Cse1 family [Mycobacterium xenopi RIVM700367]